MNKDKLRKEHGGLAQPREPWKGGVHISLFQGEQLKMGD